jgi:hypothetical protein
MSLWKRVAALLLVGGFLLAIAGCGESPPNMKNSTVPKAKEQKGASANPTNPEPGKAGAKAQ